MGYRGKVEEQAQARELRAQGWTMPDIAEKLGVSRGSVSLWTRDVPFEPRPRRRGRRREPNKLQRAKAEQIENLMAEGRQRVGQLSERDLLIAGTALYAGEGGKTDGAVSFPNSDPRMIRLFCEWLRHFFEVDETRLRVRLHLHEGLDLAAAVAFWSEVQAFRRPNSESPIGPLPIPVSERQSIRWDARGSTTRARERTVP